MDSPGSDEAIRQGCICGQSENKFGKGFVLGDNPPIFFKEPTCKLHGCEAHIKQELDDAKKKRT
jgi:hypothetical protein